MNFIACADLHLRADRPRCRLDDDWMEFQESGLTAIAEAANSHGCPVFVAGDIFNKPVVPGEVVSQFVRFCKKVKDMVYIIAGNHDLPFHSMEFVDKSSIGILFNVTRISPHFKTFSDTSVGYANFGEDIRDCADQVLVIHQLTFPDSKSIPPNVEATTAEELLEKYPRYKCIVTGDCHVPFVYRKDDRMVVNPGHMNIQKNNELDQPRVYFVDTVHSIAEEIDLPENYDLVTDEYIKQDEAREEKIQSFVEKLKTHGDFSLSFEDNIEQEIETNQKQLGSETIHVIRYLMTL